MTLPPVTLIVADDERPARKFLTGLLKSCAGVQLVGEASSGAEALSLILAQRPQLALLDLQMPEIGGLDVVRRLPPSALPLVAFVTAFDDHAIEAFELNAIDYLLKPVQRERLQATIDRARERLQSREPGRRTGGGAGQCRDGVRTLGPSSLCGSAAAPSARQGGHRSGANDCVDRLRG